MKDDRVLILAIDDVPVNLHVLGAALKGEFRILFATSGPMGIELALKEPPDLILLDVMMPEVDGFETFKRLASHPTLKKIPVIFVTALDDVESEVKGLSFGAADYITKPINIDLARHRIRNLVEREQMRMQIELQRDELSHEVFLRTQSEERIREMAFHDELTGLSNRRLLKDRLSRTIAASKRNGLYNALIYLDLDKFKELNDAHGHETGDFLLISVANRLKACVREIDTVARIGGDEFVLVLCELDADREKSTIKASLFAEKVRTKIAEPFQLDIALEKRTP
jgi:diguanylate cyclase (GGDEF)-like protein